MTPDKDDILVRRFMAQLNGGEAPVSPSPRPEGIWWRAELAKRAQARQKAVRAIEAVNAAAYFVLVAALAAVLLWIWPGIYHQPILIAGASLLVVVAIIAGLEKVVASE